MATHLASLAGPHAAKASRVLLVSRSWPLSLPSGNRHPAGTRRTIFAARQLRLLPPHAYLMSAIILLSAHGGELTFLVRGWGGAGMRGGAAGCGPCPCARWLGAPVKEPELSRPKKKLGKASFSPSSTGFLHHIKSGTTLSTAAVEPKVLPNPGAPKAPRAGNPSAPFSSSSQVSSPP